MLTIKPALGVNLKDYDPETILGGKLWRITEKIDGVRKLFYKSAHGKVTAWSRTGKEDPFLGHICEWIEQPHFPNNMVYDCELVDQKIYFTNADSFILRTETNAKASQEYMDNKADLVAICFDIFNPDGDLSTGKERTKLLTEIFLGADVNELITQVQIYGYIFGAKECMLTHLMDIISAKNGEGLMLMSMNSPYIQGRSKELVKVKRLQEFVGTIINYEMGKDDSKIAGGISALVCEVAGCSVPVRVGTGFSAALRRDLATDEIIGHQVEIEAFGRSRDKDGDISLSMPVFKQFVGV